MNEFELEEALISLVLSSDLFSGEIPFLKGEVYKKGTRSVIRNEDVQVEVLSIDDRQFQNATASIKIYVDDLNIGSPKLVPNVKRLSEVAARAEQAFRTECSSFSVTTPKFRARVSSIKRERKEELNQHCVNCLFEFVIINI